jgi:hypothetical protein
VKPLWLVLCSVVVARPDRAAICCQLVAPFGLRSRRRDEQINSTPIARCSPLVGEVKGARPSAFGVRDSFVADLVCELPFEHRAAASVTRRAVACRRGSSGVGVSVSVGLEAACLFRTLEILGSSVVFACWSALRCLVVSSFRRNVSAASVCRLHRLDRAMRDVDVFTVVAFESS